MDSSPLPQTKIQQADNALSVGDFALAIQLAEDLLRDDDTSSDGRRLLGAGLVMAGKAQEPVDKNMIRRGLGEIDKALMFDPRNSDAFYTRGIVLANLDRDDEAVPDFVEALSLRLVPRYSEALVAIHLIRTDFEAAQVALDQHIANFGTPVSVPLHETEEGERVYAFGSRTRVLLFREAEMYTCDSEELRVFGMGDSLEKAFEEWTHVFHLNYTDYVESSEPLSPDARRYAEKLKLAAEVLSS